jgi:hypothetical protein
MNYKFILIALLFLPLCGCNHHLFTDYRPLDQSGMWSSSVEQLKALNTSDTEVGQLTKMKQAGVSDDACVQVIADAHNHQHPFASGDSAVNLMHAGYGESTILEMTKVDQLDNLSGDAVMLRLVGVSDPAVDAILHKRMKGQRTLSSAEIGRLKNTGLTESQIMERINRGMTDAEADKEAAAREATRNHANTGFQRVRGRRPR